MVASKNQRDDRCFHKHARYSAPLCALILLGRRIPTMARLCRLFGTPSGVPPLRQLGMRSTVNYDLSTYDEMKPIHDTTH